MSPAVLDLIFTVAASGALLSLLLIVGLLLPWAESDLEDAEDSFRALFAPGRAPNRLQITPHSSK